MRYTGHASHVHKRAVAQVSIEHIGRITRRPRAVGHVDIDPAIAVVVGKRHAVRLANVSQSKRIGHVGERAVTPVAIEHVGIAAAHLRTAIAQIQVNPAVVIDVGRHAAHRPFGSRDARFLGHVFKGAITAISVERRPVARTRAAPLSTIGQHAVKRTPIADKNVELAVVVVVQHKRYKTVYVISSCARCVRDVGKRPIALVAIKHIGFGKIAHV